MNEGMQMTFDFAACAEGEKETKNPLKNKIDFAALLSVTMANPNGDPLDGNRPRVDLDGYGEISDVCIKRKLRNRMQDLEKAVFVQSADHRGYDLCDSLKTRADKLFKTLGEQKTEKDVCAKAACKKWLDVRSFGQVFSFRKGGKGKSERESDDSVSNPVRGPVSIHQAVSLSPVDVRSIQITKSVNGEPSEGRSSDTMGSKHFVQYGLYLLKGSINVQLAKNTGFSAEDAETLKECLRTLFVNDASAARPEGSMEVYKLYWWEHNCASGQYSSAKVHRSLRVAPKDGVRQPSCADDYVITLESLPNLEPEIIDGV